MNRRFDVPLFLNKPPLNPTPTNKNLSVLRFQQISDSILPKTPKKISQKKFQKSEKRLLVYTLAKLTNRLLKNYINKIWLMGKKKKGKIILAEYCGHLFKSKKDLFLLESLLKIQKKYFRSLISESALQNRNYLKNNQKNKRYGSIKIYNILKNIISKFFSKLDTYTKKIRIMQNGMKQVYQLLNKKYNKIYQNVFKRIKNIGFLQKMKGIRFGKIIKQILKIRYARAFFKVKFGCRNMSVLIKQSQIRVKQRQQGMKRQIKQDKKKGMLQQKERIEEQNKKQIGLFEQQIQRLEQNLIDGKKQWVSRKNMEKRDYYAILKRMYEKYENDEQIIKKQRIIKEQDLDMQILKQTGQYMLMMNINLKTQVRLIENELCPELTITLQRNNKCQNQQLEKQNTQILQLIQTYLKNTYKNTKISHIKHISAKFNTQ